MFQTKWYHSHFQSDWLFCSQVYSSMQNNCTISRIMKLILNSWIKEWWIGIIWNLMLKGKGIEDILNYWEILWLECVILMIRIELLVFRFKKYWGLMPIRSLILKNLIPKLLTFPSELYLRDSQLLKVLQKWFKCNQELFKWSQEWFKCKILQKYKVM